MTEKIDKIENNGAKLMSITDILASVWKHRAVVIALALIFGSIMYIKTANYTEDKYVSYGMLHISNKNEYVLKNSDSINSGDIDTARSLSTTYTEILKTRAFLIEVSDGLNNKFTHGELSGMLEISQVNDTEILKISVTANDPDKAVEVAKKVMELAPAKLISVYKKGEIEEIDPPLKPEYLEDRGILKNTIFGVIFGLALGAFYSLLFSIFDKKVHSGEDIADRYGISVLGEVTKVVPASKNGNTENIPEEAQKILNKDSDFDTVETYKSIRTNIMFSIPKREKGTVIEITSASPFEGKTTTSLNVAITFAQIGSKVIVVDCDLRKSRIHRYLQIERNIGVTNVVCGYNTLDEAIVKDVRENLDCLTAGKIPPNPAELLETEEFGKMIEELQMRYDYIIIDTPPTTIVTDAFIITKFCTGVVVVACLERTNYHLLDNAIKELNNTNVPIIGAIVQGARLKDKRYGYYKSKKYGYKYRYASDYKYEDKEETK